MGDQVEAAFAMVVLWFSNSLVNSLSVISDITLLWPNEGNWCGPQVQAAIQAGTGDFEAVCRLWLWILTAVNKNRRGYHLTVKILLSHFNLANAYLSVSRHFPPPTWPESVSVSAADCWDSADRYHYNFILLSHVVGFNQQTVLLGCDHNS